MLPKNNINCKTKDRFSEKRTIIDILVFEPHKQATGTRKSFK